MLLLDSEDPQGCPGKQAVEELTSLELTEDMLLLDSEDPQGCPGKQAVEELTSLELTEDMLLLTFSVAGILEPVSPGAGRIPPVLL